MLYLKCRGKEKKKTPLFSHMFVFTTTAKRKSLLQKQDAADSSARQSPAAPAPSTLRARCCVHQESIESHMEMKTINGSFIILLNGSDMRSLLNKSHQPGQVLLPLDKAQAAYKADVFPCNPAYRLWMGISMGQTPLLWEGIEPRAAW